MTNPAKNFFEQFNEKHAFWIEQKLFQLADKSLKGYSGGMWESFSYNGSASILVPPEKDSYTFVPFGWPMDAEFGSGDSARYAIGYAMTFLVLSWSISDLLERGYVSEAENISNIIENIQDNICYAYPFTDEQKRAIFLATD